jgi:hypothetical protein
MRPGTHLCAFHDDDRGLLATSTTFVSQGLAAGDRVLYVATEAGVAALLDELPRTLRRDPAELEAAGQLQLRTFSSTYGARRPAIDDLEAGFRAAAEQAPKDGFPALRVAAAMGDFARLMGSPEEVLRWERRSGAMQTELGLSSVCLYDLREVDRAFADAIAREHHGLCPTTSAAPLAQFHAVGRPWGLRVTGELDASNSLALLRLLQYRADVEPRLHVDLSGVRFADVGTLRGLHRFTDGLPGDGWLVLGSAPDLVRRVLDVTGLGHARMRLEP